MEKKCEKCGHLWLKRTPEKEPKRCPKCRLSILKKRQDFNLKSINIGERKLLKFPSLFSFSTSQCVDRFEKKTGRKFARTATVWGIWVERLA